MQRAMILFILLMFILNIYATNLSVSTSEADSSSAPTESLIVDSPASITDSISVNDSSSYLMGQNDAEIFHQPTGWFTIGFDSTLLLGPVGFFGPPIIATKDNPAFIPPNVDPSQYKKGYKKTALRMNRRASLQGSILAASILAISIALLRNATDDDHIWNNEE